MEDNIARLFFAKENPWPSGATRKIKELSRSILDVNGRFTSTEFFSARSIISVYSTENDAAQQASRTAQTQNHDKANLSEIERLGLGFAILLDHVILTRAGF
jgi:hypothetical protein